MLALLITLGVLALILWITNGYLTNDSDPKTKKIVNIVIIVMFIVFYVLFYNGYIVRH